MEKFLEEARCDPALSLLGLGGGEVEAQSRSTSVYRFESDTAGAVFVKHYRYPTLLDGIRGMFRGTLFGTDKASREFDNFRRMAEHGWNVPEPLHVGKRWGAVFLKECFLVTREIAGTVRADRFFAQVPRPGHRAHSRALLAVAEVVARMHASGFIDGSMAPRNFLLEERDGAFRVFKVDTPRGRWRTPPGRRVIEDLARLDAGAKALVSRLDRLRFLRAYFGGRLGSKARSWIPVIERARTKYDVWEAPRLKDPHGA